MTPQAAAAPESIPDALDWLRSHFRPEIVAGVTVVYQMELGGAEGGSLWARIAEGALEVAAGTAPEPDVVFRLEAVDLFAVLGGVENPDLLFLSDRLSIEGDLSTALRLRTFFGEAGN